jgi:hypothetical protein
MKTYTEEELNIQLNNCRIQERFNAWTVMANIGIPAERVPPIYREARDVVINLVNSPAKKPDEPAPPGE